MNKNDIKIAVLIVAAGTGQRMNSDLPKQYLPINGKSVIQYSIEKLKKIDAITLIQCVIATGHEDFYQQTCKEYNLPKPVIGGLTRQDSVYSGIKALKEHEPDFVLIHDAARPCITEKDIHNLINNLDKNANLTLAYKMTEFVHRNGHVIDRDNLWIIQTPQAFDYNALMNAHEKALKNNFIGTDDLSIANEAGYPTHYIPCGQHNIKITTQDDLIMAQKLLNNHMETKVGNGFDVHAFDTKDTKTIRLCGIDVPHTRALKGHSDADVGLHALTDAILGAMAQGDIGQHFPPSDDNFKNMDSHVFLDKSVDILKAQGGSLTHIDLTFMCEEPKIGKHNMAMRDHLSNHLNLSTNRISIKATTTEKLGFTGRGEGIACQAVVTVKVPIDD